MLVSEDEFNAALTRVQRLTKEIWADPAQNEPGRINHDFGGRGVYFEDPNGHVLEPITGRTVTPESLQRFTS